jgi:outer membrane protein assembly factor BamB
MSILFLASIAIWPGNDAAGQDTALALRANLSGDDAQLPLRLAAVDRLVEPLGTPEMVAKNVALLAQPMGWLSALSVTVAERNTPERWQQVLAEYEPFLRDSADVLVPIPATWTPSTSALTSVQVRKLVHERLATLPPSLLEEYRKRVDGLAANLLREGRMNHDPAPLRKIVDEMLCSRSGEQAADLLGDLAFERGEFAEAVHWWSQLATLDSAVAEPWPRFPAATIDPALPRAKQILARIFLGQTPQAARDVGAFRHRHGQVKGALAGRTGLLADLLADVLRQAQERRLFRPEFGWTTFGGSNARERPVPEALPSSLWAEGPSWRRPLPGKKNVAAPGLGIHRQPSFHPLIVDDMVLLADARAVYAYGLEKGELLWTYELKDGAKIRSSVDPSSHFTLSAGGGKLFVRLGKQKNDVEGSIVCLDLHPLPGGKRELWRLPPSGAEVFEGVPLVAGELVYVAQFTAERQRLRTAIGCYDAGAGRRIWLKEVCDAMEIEANEAPPVRHHLLTMTGGQLVYCSHSGAVVAVDPWSGRRLWGLRYPSRGPAPTDGSAPSRGLAPCVFHQDLLYVAPQDSSTLYCLDPGTGSVVWERSGLDVVHLLGANGPRLFFTTTNGLRAVDALIGQDDAGWQQPAIGKLPGLGRGLLMGDWILWPTQDTSLPMRAVCQSDGSQEGTDGNFYEPTQMRRLIAGNLAYAHGCLVVAGNDELAVYLRR